MMKKLVLDNQKENQQLRTSFKNLERQFGLMANNQNIRPVGALPSDTEKYSQVNSVTLRNGRELVEVVKKKKKQSGLEEERVPKPVEVDERNKRESEQISERVPPHFPQILRKKNDHYMFHKFLDMLKQIHLNIPLVDMLREIPKYAKYIKDIVENKRRLTEFETDALTEECTSRIQYKLPQKLKDPGSFTIPVRIGEIDVGRALCDLGSSINLMPLSMFKQLGLGALETHHGASTIGKFIFPADFIILDYEADELVPIILGQTLLPTRDAIIKVREVSSPLRGPGHNFNDEDPMSVAVETSAFKEDALEKALMLFNHLELEEEVEEMLQILDASCEYIRERSQFEPLDRPIGLPPRPSVEEAPKLELKPLPSHLHYEEKILGVIREHKHAIGWTMSEIKGISPAFCMNKICMEEGHKPGMEHQRRLNPIMKEVIRKEVIKWLVIGIVFPISDNYRKLNNATRKDHFPLPFIEQMLDRLLEKDVSFKFDDACLKAFEELKKKLVSAPIIVTPHWKELFELMCDASDGAIGAVLGQRRSKSFHFIYYAKKELLAVVRAFDKFRAYLVSTKVIVYTDHAAIRYLFEKKYAKPRLIRWVLLLKEFDLEIRDQKGIENQVADGEVPWMQIL
ncbi:uncharacterized protein LOC142175776 [Nicotiana tabacum]|uniref:Uncharacterized protein LOC142175776 n=1 Tax=Nicotiana tabacum TaxID=4097 RepID=A0AC58TNT1_TOBAC